MIYRIRSRKEMPSLSRHQIDILPRGMEASASVRINGIDDELCHTSLEYAFVWAAFRD
jgi:hypothetical protein